MLRPSLLSLIVLACCCGPLVAQVDTVDDLLQQATQADKRGDHKLAIARLTEVINKEPKLALAWRLRGRANFCAGNVKDSVADFDHYVVLTPDAAKQQWERGIAYYYAGEFKKGAKQFEDYQTFHNQDVENSAWRYLCVAKDEGVDKAKAELLLIESDGRVPMMEIYGLYQGKKKPEDVLAAAGQDNLALFYAHLYIGLWHEVAGRAEEAKTNILAAEKHKIGHYMWDVAHIHAERLRAAEKKADK